MSFVIGPNGRKVDGKHDNVHAILVEAVGGLLLVSYRDYSRLFVSATNILNHRRDEVLKLELLLRFLLGMLDFSSCLIVLLSGFCLGYSFIPCSFWFEKPLSRFLFLSFLS